MSSCPAQGGIVRAMVHDSYAPERVAEAMLACAPADAGIAWERLERAKKLIELIERALKTRCSSEGSLPLPDGGVVRPVEVSRESIDVMLAVPALAQHLGIPEDAARAACSVSMTKTAAEALARAAGGSPSAALVALRAAGAIKATTTTSYRVSKPKGE